MLFGPEHETGLVRVRQERVPGPHAHRVAPPVVRGPRDRTGKRRRPVEAFDEGERRRERLMPGGVNEIVLDRPLEKSAFRTRMLAADLIEPVARMRNRSD